MEPLELKEQERVLRAKDVFKRGWRWRLARVERRQEIMPGHGPRVKISGSRG